MPTPRLGVNIDHIATLRQARGTPFPDPVEAAHLAEKAGAHGITLHIREDRRHVQVHDLQRLREGHPERYINLEMALTEEMLNIALLHRPQACCIVPEKREELTTEGGLNVLQHAEKVTAFTHALQAAGIAVSLFIDPCKDQIKAAHRCGARVIELHTGDYAEQHRKAPDVPAPALTAIQSCCTYAESLGLTIHAGHGLSTDNVQPISAIAAIQELNIGHAIIARAVFIGLENAVKEMLCAMQQTG